MLVSTARLSEVPSGTGAPHGVVLLPISKHPPHQTEKSKLELQSVYYLELATVYSTRYVDPAGWVCSAALDIETSDGSIACMHADPVHRRAASVLAKRSLQTDRQTDIDTSQSRVQIGQDGGQ